ncbi:MAG: hypothetical protein AAGI46_16965 [Planctomycetota bacterium]
MTFDPVALPANEPPKKKGKVLLIIGGLLTMVSVVLMIVGGIAIGSIVTEFGSGMSEFDAPGSTTFSATDSGNYRLYSDGGVEPAGLSVTVTAPDDSSVSVQSATIDERFEGGGPEWVAIRGFTLPAAGTYEIEVTADEGESAAMLVGPSIMSFAGSGAVGGISFCIGVPLLLAGVVCLIIGLIRRLSS